MTARFVAAFACTLCLTSDGLAQKAARLTFAWPVPGRVVVTEASTKGGQTAQVRYEVTLRRDPKGKNLHLRLRDFTILSIEGVDLKDPKVKADLDRANKLAAAIPTLVVSPAGRFVDVIEYEAMVDQVLASLPGVDARTREVLKAPATMAMMKQKSIDFWQLWVGAWVDAKLPVRGARSETQTFPMPDGSKVDGKVTFIHRGIDKANPKFVELELEGRLEGEAVTRAMRRFLETMSGAPADSHAHADESIASISKITSMRVLTDPTTLRPRMAESEAIMQVTSKTGESQKQVERHSYQFDWR